MWHAAGLEEPNAKGAKGAEGGADADAEMEVDNLAAGGGFLAASLAGWGASSLGPAREGDGACIPYPHTTPTAAEGP
jgi:hypothetical protein